MPGQVFFDRPKGMKFLREVRQTVKQSGFRGALKRYGWKLVAAVFCYYLVRDVTLYLVIPYFLTKHLMSP
jgi:hypothetical protein